MVPNDGFKRLIRATCAIYDKVACILAEFGLRIYLNSPKSAVFGF